MRSLCVRLWPVLLTLGTVYGVWLLLGDHQFRPPDPVDGYILTYIGAAYTVAALFLLVFTRRWTMRGLGQLCTAVADAVIYLGSGTSVLGWRDSPRSIAELNLIRALFVVGGTLLMFGLFWWAGSTNFGRRIAPPTEPATVLPDAVIPRRRATDFGPESAS